MKKYRLLILGLTISAMVGCSNPTRTFSIYEFNPLKEVYVKNNIRSYVEFGMERGKVEKGDSITLNDNGNIESRINKGWGFSEDHFKYDSLSRVRENIQQSDIFNIVRFSYESFPEKRLLVKNTWLAERQEDKGELVRKELLEFDKDLKRILKKTAIDNNDTIVTTYEYEDEQISKEIRDEITITEYVYEDKKLVEIKKLLVAMAKHGSFFVTDYLSRETGLIDSTVEKRLTTRRVKYYKYYPK